MTDDRLVHSLNASQPMIVTPNGMLTDFSPLHFLKAQFGILVTPDGIAIVVSFLHFVNAYSPLSIISYCDLSKFVGKIYNKLGFRCLRKSAPAKHWYNLKTKEHYTDNFIRQRGYDQIFHTSFGKGVSNDVLMLEAGFVEVYDCGQATYVWKA